MTWLALPLVSPDGRFLAVESGVAPTWPMVLADPNAEPIISHPYENMDTRSNQ